MFLTKRLGFQPFVAYEAPDTTQGGAGAATATPPTQPTAPGQGQQGQGQDGFWGNFPNVPDEQRSVLEPHLREVQGYVTQLEQKIAPLKSYTPEQVQGLAAFAEQFDANPVGMWMKLTEDLQTRGIIHESLDLESLQAIAEGRDEEEPETPETAATDEMPTWAVELKERLDRQEQERQREQQTRQQRIEDVAFQRQLESIKTKLKDAGVDVERIPEKRLVAAFITHNGNADAVVKDEVDYRNATLKGYVDNHPAEGDLETPRGAPQPNNGRTKKPAGDAFAQASIGAEQFLKQANKHGAQG